MAITRAEAFGIALRQAREKRGFSQEDAAHAAGLDRSYYGHVERATYAPTLDTIWKVADALELRPSQLLVATERILSGRGAR